METQNAKRIPTSEELYKRLVTLVAPNGADREFPEFTMEQLLENHPDAPPAEEPLLVAFGCASSRCDAEARVKEWLGQPVPALGGKCPGVLLQGSDRERERLASFIASIEQGVFS